MADIKDKSIQKFLDELASAAPAPGGGASAALAGAQAAALISMVCNLTIGKQNYEASEADMQSVLIKTEQLRFELTEIIQADMDVFNHLMAAYGLAKETEQEKVERSQQIQQILKEATLIPLACAKACAEILKLSEVVADKGNLNVISDAGVAVLLAQAGLKSSALNVYVNTAGLKDQLFANEKLKELERLLEGSGIKTEEVYQLVKSKL